MDLWSLLQGLRNLVNCHYWVKTILLANPVSMNQNYLSTKKNLPLASLTYENGMIIFL